MGAAVKVRGTEYPCRVTMGAMVRFEEMTGHDVSEMRQSSITELLQFMWCCIKSASSADGTDFGISFGEFADCMEPEDVNAFYKAMSESQKKTAGGADPGQQGSASSQA